MALEVDTTDPLSLTKDGAQVVEQQDKPVLLFIPRDSSQNLSSRRPWGVVRSPGQLRIDL